MSTVRLIQGDCLKILPTLDVAGIDAVIADPPYGIAHRAKHGASWEVREIANDRDPTVRDGIIGWAELNRKPWACFGTWKRPKPEGTRGVLIWDKGPSFGMGDLSFPWKGSYEEIYIGGPGWKGPRDEGIIRGHIVESWESRGRVHQHQKPVSLITYLISRLPGIRTICDPTMGSGSMGVAAIRSDLGFIGIESDEETFAVASKRIDAEQARHPLFEVPRPAQVEMFA